MDSILKMRLIYLSNVCAQSRFDDLVGKGRIKSQFQNQKFHHLLLKGLSELNDFSIHVISFYVMNRTKKIHFHHDEECEDKVHYIYPSYFDLPIIHHITKSLSTYKYISKLYHRDSVIVCNIMNFDECVAALAFRMFHKVRICAITADVPGITSGAGNKDGSWWKRLAKKCASPFYKYISQKYDAYMYLAEEMKNVINKDKPHIVVEGLADLAMAEIPNELECKYPTKTLMYAGGLHREYGIQMLVEAFRKLPDNNLELHIFGKGNYENELIEIAKTNNRIKYFGTRENKEIVLLQTKAHVLINPRPTDSEFVKYSFPSKIIECMASGTPLLTTRIPSMPADYYPHIYCFDDESIEGYYKAMAQIIRLPKEELSNKGKKAKEFILNNKNYRIQSQKLSKLLISLSNPAS